MAIHYTCRHCGLQIGTIHNRSMYDNRLGFDCLDDEEKEEMIQLHNTGEIHVKAICEDCHDFLTKNPTFYQSDYYTH